MLYIHKPSHNRYVGSICTRGGQPTSQLWYDECSVTGKRIVFLGYETEKFCFVCLSLHSTTLPKVATAVQQEVLHRKTATYNYYKTTKDQSTKSTGIGRACSSCTAPRKKILKCVCRKMFVPNRQSNALLIKNTLNGFYGRKQTHPQQRTVLHTLTHEDIVLGRTDVRRMSSCERKKI